MKPEEHGAISKTKRAKMWPVCGPRKLVTGD